MIKKRATFKNGGRRGKTYAKMNENGKKRYNRINLTAKKVAPRQSK